MLTPTSSTGTKAATSKLLALSAFVRNYIIDVDVRVQGGSTCLKSRERHQSSPGKTRFGKSPIQMQTAFRQLLVFCGLELGGPLQ
jgi:hypothetical protein